MKARYLNPFTDFGFKKLFGEEASKPLLIDFLNALLPLSDPITELQFRNAEQLGVGIDDRRSIYDIYCKDSQGKSFIVEMQKSYQKYFKDRTLFYSTFPIQEQAEKGPWKFELKAVYCIGILDFVFEDDASNTDYLHEVHLKNRHNQVFYDKLALYFIELPKFHKAESELASQLENWVYLIKHLEELPGIPERFQNTILEQAFDVAELAHLSETDRSAYEHSLKVYRDNLNILDTARELAFEEGKLEGEAIGLEKGEFKKAIESAQRILDKGMSLEFASEVTGLSVDVLRQYLNFT